jgi:hypothetical protein
MNGAAAMVPPVQRAYVVGASKERLPRVRQRLQSAGFDVCGHCDHPREFCPPGDCDLVLLITDMGSHAAIQKAREYCRLRDLPCVGGLWRTWSTTRQRLTDVVTRPPVCDAGCPLGARCPARSES